MTYGNGTTVAYTYDTLDRVSQICYTSGNGTQSGTVTYRYDKNGRQLRAGDRLQMLNGEYVIIEQVQHEILESPIGTYNFEVEGFHTYHVGNLEVLVHNKCGGETSSTINGKRMHQNWNYGDGVLKEKRIAPGSRVDGIDWANRIVYELKPNNPRAIQRGLRQLDRYLGVLGEDWLGILLTY